MHAKKIFIFDTTLRDGQQSPGAGMRFEDNIRYADYADKLNIDVLEAGFPSASQTDFKIVNFIAERMAKKGSNMTIAGLCQLREAQVIKTMQALEPALAAKKARVHVYLPVDPNLAQASLGRKNDQDNNIAEVYRLIKIATDKGFEVEFSAEGYSRLGDGFDYVTELFKSAVHAGASVINCPDTIGGACAREGDHYFVHNMNKHAKIIHDTFPDKDIIWSAHCHNDFGLALENSMNAVFAGPARQIEACINGVGERAGNAALEQCVMYIDAFGNQPEAHYYTDINIEGLKEVSDFIAKKMLPKQPHSPIVGLNATRHTSGGHTNAILKNPLAYQPFDPKSIGSEVSFVFGPLSGGNHAKKIIEEFGYVCHENEKAQIAQQIKDYYHDRRKGITDLELLKAYKHIRAPIKPDNIAYGKSEQGNTYIHIKGQFFEKDNIHVDISGKNSALAALVEATKAYFPGIEVKDYYAKSLTESGIDSNAQATIVITADGQGEYKGIAKDSDIEVSALKAFIEAINQMYVEKHYRIETRTAQTQENAYA
ncbi:LeuA family protein [Facilibium subflavum]|uniref:LeuA family protein n=1 Tax=Facilibium subflavum TaxID=2219058 RepID=UPI000E64AE26|nr:alpha-isopropylmalate synthase regulatory domain-containing protein [Facilibium subflavum]